MDNENKDVKMIQKEKFIMDFINQINNKVQQLHHANDESVNRAKILAASLGSQIKGLEIEHDLFASATAKSFHEGSKKIDDVMDQFKSICKVFHAHTTQMENFITENEADKKISPILTEIEKFNDKLKSMRNSLENEIKDCNAAILAKMRNMKEEILSVPRPIEEYKKEFQEKIDFVDLNSKNSLLRTVNCEKSIQLIERKLEQIHAMIRSIQIDMQKA